MFSQRYCEGSSFDLYPQYGLILDTNIHPYRLLANVNLFAFLTIACIAENNINISFLVLPPYTYP
jgi:hypothetical protein